MINGPIEQSYLARTPHSAAQFVRAQAVLAGGNTRQSVYWRPYPLTLERADGSHVWDIDGNRYIDLLNNYTALVHGHNYPPIVAAVERQIRDGSCWAASCLEQISLAEQVVARIPSVAQVRFVNSGTEAANLALTIARTVTGRDSVLMARHGYHGSLIEFESGHTNRDFAMTYLAEFNNAADFVRVLEEHGDEIAAVFLEPVLGAGGVIPGDRDFFAAVIAAARGAGALFVLDEVLTFRLATGGLQSTLDLEPDLTMLGKFIGGGYPVGAVGGRRELMQEFDPDGGTIFHGGTFNGNPVTMAAGAVSVAELTAERIEMMGKLAVRLRAGLLEAAAAAGLPLTVNCVGSIMNLHFSADAASPAAHRSAAQMLGPFHLAALNHGVFIAPRGLIAVSTVMTEELIDEALERCQAAMHDVVNQLATES
jgi:glutamate-1-semialdehyde 2,1-aminomutase